MTAERTVTRWYRGADGRVAQAVYVAPSEAAAQSAYVAARRGRWVPEGAEEWGVTHHGFTPDGVVYMGPVEALERLERDGQTEAAAGLRRALQRGTLPIG